MVPVISGANDADLAVSTAQTKVGLFALFGPFSAQARELVLGFERDEPPRKSRIFLEHRAATQWLK